MCSQGVSGDACDPLGDLTVGLRGSHYLGAGPPVKEPRGIPCGPISSRACKPHLMTPPASQGFGYWGSMSTCGTTKTDAAGTHVNSLASWT